jgi:phosphatidylinositol alpha-1,6-mannosyltransferase
VLLLSDVFPPRKGGSGRWLWELYRRLPELDVAVVAGGAPGDRAFDGSSPLPVERLRRRFPSWGLLNRRGSTAYLSAVAQVRRAAARHKSRAIHCGKVLPEGLVGLVGSRLLGVPYLCYAHGEELTLARQSRELRWLAQLVFSRASKVIANSQHTERLLFEDWHIPPERTVVLTPGVDTTRFTPAPPDPVVRQMLGWTDRRVILTVGALQKRKGQDTVIRALPAIRARCPDVMFAVVGEGWELDYLRQLAAECGVADIVRFHGVLEDDIVVQCQQQCDVFVLANRKLGWDFEGFGIVLLEAQACGKPVITGASGGTAETLIPGETGQIVNADTPDELVPVVIDLLENREQCAEMGARGRRWVVARFDWNVLSRRALHVFGDLGGVR